MIELHTKNHVTPNLWKKNCINVNNNVRYNVWVNVRDDVWDNVSNDVQFNVTTNFTDNVFFDLRNHTKRK